MLGKCKKMGSLETKCTTENHWFICFEFEGKEEMYNQLQMYNYLAADIHCH